MNFKQVLNELHDNFEVVNFTDDTSKVFLKDSYNEELRDDFRDIIHGVEMMPNDLRFDMINNVIESMLNYDFDNDNDLIEFMPEICDSLIDVCNYSLINWLSSHHHRQDYCNEALELGMNSSDIIGVLSCGQYLEYQELFNSIIEFCNKNSEV